MNIINEVRMDSKNTFIGFLCGSVGGGGKYLMDINATFPVKLFEAAITALICGFIGVFVKHLYDLFVKERVEKFFKKS